MNPAMPQPRVVHLEKVWGELKTSQIISMSQKIRVYVSGNTFSLAYDWLRCWLVALSVPIHGVNVWYTCPPKFYPERPTAQDDTSKQLVDSTSPSS